MALLADELLVLLVLVVVGGGGGGGGGTWRWSSPEPWSRQSRCRAKLVLWSVGRWAVDVLGLIGDDKAYDYSNLELALRCHITAWPGRESAGR